MLLDEVHIVIRTEEVEVAVDDSDTILNVESVSDIGVSFSNDFELRGLAIESKEVELTVEEQKIDFIVKPTPDILVLAAGNIGPTGPEGPEGLRGPTGPVGATGADSTVPGPEGPKGDTGDTGPAGADSTVPGPQGPQGVKGDTGDIGPTGATGSQGPQGVKGDTGNTGSQGIQGVAGTPGEKWFSGTGAPAGATGIVGDWYLNDANGDIYEKTGASAWTLRDNLTGPQGPTGATGAAGSPATIPARLDISATLITNWNTEALETGWYRATPGTNSPTAFAGSLVIGRVERAEGFITQTVWQYALANSTLAPKYERRYDGNWGPWILLGVGGGVDYIGTWGAGTTYKKGDVVTHNGVDYLAVNDSTGSTPPAPATPIPALPADAVVVAATRLISTKLLVGDAQPVFRVMGDGKHEWGAGGASALDTSLYRSAAAKLATVGAFQAGTLFAGGDIQSTGALGARIGAVNAGDGVEFGHSNPAGYRSHLGCENGSGIAWLMFYGEHGSTGSLYRSRGFKSIGIRGNHDGTLAVFSVANANADNQASIYAPILASAFTVSSDRKLKVDIQDFKSENAVNKLLSAKSYLYGRFKDDKKQLGLMADELPEDILVEMGDPEAPTKGVDLYALVSLMLQTIQQQEARIVSLERGLT